MSEKDTEQEEASEIERRCIRRGTPEKFPTESKELTDTTLCGRKVHAHWNHKARMWSWHEWIFCDPTHAVLTGINGSSIYVCEKCADVAIKALERLK